jgi:hypothetical protein
VRTALEDLLLPFPDVSLLLKDKVTGTVLLNLPRVSSTSGAQQRTLLPACISAG